MNITNGQTESSYQTGVVVCYVTFSLLNLTTDKKLNSNFLQLQHTLPDFWHIEVSQ